MAHARVLASAPNINGSIRTLVKTSNGPSSFANGVFSKSDERWCDSFGSGNMGVNYATFTIDSSTSSPIYGRTSKLYPDHYACKWYIKYK